MLFKTPEPPKFLSNIHYPQTAESPEFPPLPAPWPFSAVQPILPAPVHTQGSQQDESSGADPFHCRRENTSIYDVEPSVFQPSLPTAPTSQIHLFVRIARPTWLSLICIKATSSHSPPSTVLRFLPCIPSKGRIPAHSINVLGRSNSNTTRSHLTAFKARLCNHHRYVRTAWAICPVSVHSIRRYPRTADP